MKKTAFTDTHIALGAKMHEFAGYYMPIEYSGINDEHLTVRNHVGVFDISHMGVFQVKGAGAYDLLQFVCSNNIEAISIGQAQYNYLPNENGGIVDDILVYRVDTDSYMLVVNASNTEKDWEWLNRHNSFGATLINDSSNTIMLAVQGPKAAQVIGELTDLDLSTMPYYHFAYGKFAEIDQILISNTGYTGAGGYEIYFPRDMAKKIWDALFETGEKYGIKPIGLGARDTLRLEMGYCLYGNEINETTSPFEAGLGWITKFTEGKEFIGREQLEADKKGEIKRRLIRFELTERGIPRTDYEIINEAGEAIGRVTSGMMHPETRTGLGLAYVDAPYYKGDLPFFVKIRNKNIPAVIVK